MRTRRTSLALLATASVIVMSACSAAQSPSPSQIAAPSAAASAAPSASQTIAPSAAASAAPSPSGNATGTIDCSTIKSAAIVHFVGPYTQTLMDGAKAAADECGSPITTAGPPAFDTPTEVAMFNDAVSAGAKAITVVAYPAEFWIRTIDEAVGKGVAVSTYDVASPSSLMSLHTAPKAKDLGIALADTLVDKLGESATGKVVTGLCIPGLDILEARVVGFKAEIAKRAPGLTVEGPFDVSFDQTENFARWKDLIDQNPDSVANIGFCENDLPSLVRIKEADPSAKYEIGSVGINPDGLKGIADGVALVAVDQKPFLQGYVAMRAMLDSLVAGKPVPRGWIDIHPEIVTAANVAAVTAREASLANGTSKTQAYYQPEIDAIFSDLPGHVQSFSDLLGQ